VREAYHVRYRTLRRRGAEPVVVFRNHGAASGTSLAHPPLAGGGGNLVVHSAPAGEEDLRSFVWHVQVTPRVGTPAGFELATGIPVVTVPPEESAAMLRALL
jgi:galactose-1-phosphate uridylyltransferase